MTHSTLVSNLSAARHTSMRITLPSLVAIGDGDGDGVGVGVGVGVVVGGGEVLVMAAERVFINYSVMMPLNQSRCRFSENG